MTYIILYKKRSKHAFYGTFASFFQQILTCFQKLISASKAVHVMQGFLYIFYLY